MAAPGWPGTLGEPISRSRTGTVHRIRLPLAGQEAVVFVKVFRNRNALGAAKSLVKRSRARFAWEGAHGLADRGFQAAVPLVFEERRVLGVHVSSVFACREVPGRPWLAAFESEGLDLVARTAAWIGRLHRAGVDHRALAPKNLFVREDTIVPIEYDRVRFGRRIPRSRRDAALALFLKNLRSRLGPEDIERARAAHLEASADR
mgnify:FL=1